MREGYPLDCGYFLDYFTHVPNCLVLVVGMELASVIEK